MGEDSTKVLSNVIRIDDERIQDHLKHIVRGSVEETLNALLDAEAERLVGAGRYERTLARRDTRADSYERKLHTTAGEVKLKVPKLRRQTFETAIPRVPLRGPEDKHRALSTTRELGRARPRRLSPSSKPCGSPRWPNGSRRPWT